MSKISLICENCGITFLRQRSNAKQAKRNFCGNDCVAKARKGINPFPDRKVERKMMFLVSCAYCSTPVYKWNYSLKKYKFHFCNSQCGGKWASLHQTAEKASNWKGGTYSTIARCLSNSRYIKIRNLVRKLDNFECALCKSDIRLQVHHIIEKGKNAALIYDVTNLITLCKKCHCSIRGNEESYIGYFNDIVAKRMNSGKPHRANEGNPEPSLQSRKVQRLLEHSDMLNNQISVRPERDEIVQVR